MGFDYKTQQDVIFYCVVFLTINTFLRTLIELYFARKSNRNYKTMYLEEVKDHGETSIKLVMYTGALKISILEECSRAYNEIHQDYLDGKLNTNALEEQYLTLYQTFSYKCQEHNLEEMQGLIDEMYAKALSTLPKQ